MKRTADIDATCLCRTLQLRASWSAREAAVRKAMELERQHVSREDFTDLIDAQGAIAESAKNGAKTLEQIVKEFEI
ncbi:MAG TPA: hypothetical protein VIR79_03030 [Nitrospira sp.]